MKNEVNEADVVANEGICNVMENEAFVAEEVLDGIEPGTPAEAETENGSEGADEENGVADEPTDDADNVERLIAEAEARGYERGRSEGIEAWLQEGRSKVPMATRNEPESEVMILNNMRKSMWE